jgi:hypothetical protein
MIRAVYRKGKIQPVDAVPGDWREGQELEIRELPRAAIDDEFAQWLSGGSLMSDSARAELDRRLAELHRLGPLELEPEEVHEFDSLLKNMDEASRRQMQQLGEPWA